MDFTTLSLLASVLSRTNAIPSSERTATANWFWRTPLLVGVLIVGMLPLLASGQDSANVSVPFDSRQVTRPEANIESAFGKGETQPSTNVTSVPLEGKSGMQRLLAEINPFAPLKFEVIPDYYDPFGLQMGTSSWGRQGYRLGWSSFNEFALLPTANAHGTSGSMKFVEWNSNAKYSKLIRSGMLFNGTFWFSGHWWDGPTGIDLPSDVDQVSSDLELGWFSSGPWSGQFAFHPQIVASYEGKFERTAFNFDGRAVTTYQASPHLSFVGGVAIWDRADTLVVPHVGVISTPNDRLEIRALFPKSRVSYFLGRWRQTDFWLYGQYEYRVESWQTTIGSLIEYNDRSQFTDQRLTAGLRWDSGRYIFYTEAGYVFDRQVKFEKGTPSFDLSDTSIFTIGLRY